MTEKTDRDRGIFQSYLNTIKEKTGKTPDDFRKLMSGRGFQKTGEVVAWLKTEHGLGHGHAMALVQVIMEKPSPASKGADALADHFKGEKAKWRKPVDALCQSLLTFGPDVEIAPNNTYINLVRGVKKFGVIQVSAVDRLDVGIKHKQLPAAGRLEASGSWNTMVTHRVRITNAAQLDAELMAWLKGAYEAAAK